MGKEKLLRAVQNNPQNVKFEDFCKAMEFAGFELDRQKGSHKVYKHPIAKELMVVQPRKDGNAKPYQVRQFLDAVEKNKLSDPGSKKTKEDKENEIAET